VTVQPDDHRSVGWPGITNIKNKLPASELLHGFTICHKVWRRSKFRAAKTRETGFNHGPLGSCQPRRAAHSPVPIGIARRQQRHRMRGPDRTAPTAKENPLELKPVTPTAKRAEAFTGDVYVNPIYKGEDPSRMIVSLVRFTPGAHTYWHSHALGQTLHVTDGIGLVATRDGTVIQMRQGDTIYTPPGEDHWHGATATNMMCHLSMFEGIGDSDGVTWHKPVTDDEHRAANSGSS
jgi:quercetin dioxygenase-like cupin family protein